MAEQQHKGAHLQSQDVEWVINDNGELGVKIGTTFFWLYKGESSLQDPTDPEQIYPPTEGPHLWRKVRKREFGEVCRPVTWSNLELRDPDAWQVIGAEVGTAKTRDQKVREWVSTYLSYLTPEQHEGAVKHFSSPTITLEPYGYYSDTSGGWITKAHVNTRREN